MKLSETFIKTLKDAPKDEVSRNAQILIRAGFIYKEMAGVYTFLPFGLRVMKKIEQIIREEMNKIGGQEMLMTTLQDSELWKKTNRWDDKVMDNWFKTKLASGKEVGIANTHEEPLTQILSHFVSSYKDLPFYVYQFQNKFRNEIRAKSGIMRVREFIMKDLYSFNKTEKEFKEFYEKCADAYMKIFNRVGIGDITYRTIASGGAFTGNFTDEFQTISEAGEDTIYIDKNKKIAINKEIYTDDNLKKLNLDKSKLKPEKAIEVGNIFPLGTKYSEKLNLCFKDIDGKKHPVIMGSYGIGLGRLMGTVVEVLSDEKGIVWPSSISPFKVHLVGINLDDPQIKKEADKLYKVLTDKKIEVLYDDRLDLSAGEKFADADLIGLPIRIVVSKKNLKNKKYEYKERKGKNVKFVSLSEIFKLV